MEMPELPTMDVTFQPFQVLQGQLEGFLKNAVALIPNLMAATVVVLVTWLIAWAAAAVVARGLRRARSRDSLISAVRKLAKILVWLAGLMVAMTILFPGLTPSSLLAGLGVGSIAVGLAFKDTFENFLAGFLILMRKPMRIGDDIRCGDIFGQVERITIRDTYVRQRSGELILVPNSHLFRNPTTILTDRDLRRIEVIAGVAYDEDIDQARDVIREAVESLDTVSKDREVQVFAYNFNSSSIDYKVRWWTESTPIGEHRSRDQVVSAIKRALDDAGIEIPFPYRTLTFKGPLPVRQMDGDAQRMAAE